MDLITYQEIIDSYDPHEVRYFTVIGTNTAEEQEAVDIYFSTLINSWLYPDDKELVEVNKDGLVTNAKEILSQEVDGKEYKYKKVRMPLNKPFFKVGLKRDEYGRPEDPRFDSSYKVIDQDYDKWNYKTWIFTNIPIEENTVHFLDRTNRQGLVQFKNDMPDTLYYTLNIPKTAKGIFIVKDTVCARSEFTNKGCYSYKNPKSIIDITKESNPIKGNSYDKSPRYKEADYPALLRPKDMDKISRLEQHRLFQEDGLDKIEREASGIPLQPAYPSLFNSGYDRMLIDKFIYRNDALDILRWKSIVDAHYDNFNMDITIGNMTSIEDKNVYDSYIRNNIGALSNFIYKLPTNYDEADLYKLNNDIMLDANNAYHCSTYRPKDKIRSGYIPHRDLVTYEDLIKQAPTVLTNAHNRYDVRSTIEKMNKRIRQYMLRKNTISFEDIIFIPYDKIRDAGEQYYCEETDLMFILTKHNAPKEVIHPFSRIARLREFKEEANKLPTDRVITSIAIYNRKDADRNTIYYTKVFGEVVKVVVQKADSQGKSDYIRISRGNHLGELDTTETYPYTEANLNMLELYRDRNMAHNYGYDERIYNQRVNEVKFKELETDVKLQELKLSIEEVKYKKFKEDLEHSIWVNKFSLRELIFNRTMDLKEKAIQIEYEAHQMYAKHAIERLKAHMAIHDSTVDRYLANINLRTQNLKYKMAEMSHKQAQFSNVIETGYLIKDMFNLVGKVLS